MLWRIKYLTRIKEIAQVMIRHGFQDLLLHLGLGDVFPSSTDESPISLLSKMSLPLQENNDKLALAQHHDKSEDAPLRLRQALQELGPVFIKFGQLLSTRPDLIPEAYVEELRSLQDDIPPVPYETIRAIIEQELGQSLEKLFLQFEVKPLATASIGQAHIATLYDGRSVVVKVQRPDILPIIQNDLELLTEVAHYIHKKSPQSQRYDLPNMVDTLSRTLIYELDYRSEARNTTALRRHLKEFEHIVVPEVIESHSSKQVLTTTRIIGVKAAEASHEFLDRFDLKPLADELARSYLKQICLDGFFHSDPHPGNLLLMEPEERPRRRRRADKFGVKIGGEYWFGGKGAEGEFGIAFDGDEPPVLPRVALIDCGMMSVLTRSFQEKLIQLLFFLSENHGERVAEVAIDMGTPMGNFDQKAFRSWVTDLVSQYYNTTLEVMDLGQLIFRIIQTATHTGLQVPAELTMIAKTLFNLDITLLRLAPNFRLIDVIRCYSSELVMHKFRQEFSYGRLYSTAVQLQHLLTDLPKKIDQVIDRLNDDELRIRINIDRDHDILKAIQKVANRITIGMITAAIIVGSAIIMHIQTDFKLFGYPGLAIAGFLLASGFGAILIINMLMGDEK